MEVEIKEEIPEIKLSHDSLTDKLLLASRKSNNGLSETGIVLSLFGDELGNEIGEGEIVVVRLDEFGLLVKMDRSTDVSADSSSVDSE